MGSLQFIENEHQRQVRVGEGEVGKEVERARVKEKGKEREREREKESWKEMENHSSLLIRHDNVNSIEALSIHMKHITIYEVKFIIAGKIICKTKLNISW